jgi:hypothetical protein
MLPIDIQPLANETIWIEISDPNLGVLVAIFQANWGIFQGITALGA